MSKLLLAFAAVAGALVVAGPLPAAQDNSYSINPLVSDQFPLVGPADGTLVNAWGLVAGLRPTGSTPWWVSDNGTNASTLYTGAGSKANLHRRRPRRPDRHRVQRHDRRFPVAGGRRSSSSTTRPARSSAWRGGTARRRWSTAARRARSTRASRSRARGAGPRLYATDFHNGHVDVFDGALDAGRPAGRVRRPGPPGRLRAVRDPGDRRPDLRHLREAGRRTRGRGRRPGPRLRRRLRHERARCSPASRSTGS